MMKAAAFACLIAPIMLSGCVVSQEVYVQEATVSGSVNNPPLNVVLDSAVDQVRLSPHFSLTPSHQVSGTIKDDFGLNGGRPYRLQWNLPDFAVGVGIDYSLTPSLSLAAGGQLSAVGPTEIWGGYLGFGLRSLKSGVGVRFDAGIMVSGFNHDAYSVVVTHVDYVFGGSSTDTAYFHDRGRNVALDFYASLTLNSKFSESPVNVFLSGSVFRQTLMNYSPASWSERHPFVSYVGSSGDAEYRVTAIGLTPGVSIDVSDRLRLLAGWRLVTFVDTDLSPSAVGSPFLQMAFTP